MLEKVCDQHSKDLSDDLEYLIEMERSVGRYVENGTLEVWFEGFFKRFITLKEELKSGFLLDCVREYGEKSIPLLEILLERDESLNLCVIELLGFIPSQLSVELLSKTYRSTFDKVYRKSIRKALYSLKARKLDFDPDLFFTQEKPILQPLTPLTKEAYSSFVWGNGDRLIWLVIPKFSTGLYFYQMIVNDIRGIMNCHVSETTEREFLRFKEEYMKNKEIILVEIPTEYCICLIKELQELGEEKGRTLPDDYVRFKGKIGFTEDIEDAIHPVYNFISKDEIMGNDQLTDKIGDVLKLPEFIDWFVFDEKMDRYLEMIKEAYESKIILSQIEKKARIERIYIKMVQELFDSSITLQYKKRLEVNSYVLLKLGRADDARLVLSAALSLENNRLPSHYNKFLLRLLERTVEARLEVQEFDSSHDKYNLIV